MKCQKYKVKVYDSIDSVVHDDYSIIDEVYIPVHNLAFNYHNNNLNVFSALNPRLDTLSELSYVEINDDLIKELIKISKAESRLVLLKDGIKYDIKNIFNSINKSI